ncbi:MAG: hypothetical protein JXA25_20760 [Anaerolineales bacterium]|nr:hypothetical protein [Anaerolineales bacterium]
MIKKQNGFFSPSIIILIILGIGLITGILLADDYGQSRDEELHHLYALQTIEIYKGLREPANTIANLRYYGPIYSIFVQLAGQLVEKVSGWHYADAHHFLYYASFLLAVYSFYMLSLRITGSSAAAAATLLFASQPVLFGHSFINPKDIPFMAFFLYSIQVGLSQVDRYVEKGQQESHERKLSVQNVKLAWKSLNPKRRYMLAVLAVFMLVVILDLVFFHTALGLAERTISRAYEGAAQPWINRLFQRVATDAYKTDLAVYLNRLESQYHFLRFPAAISLLILALYLFFRQLHLYPGGFWGILFAGIAAGLATSIRFFGLYVLALTGLYMLLVSWRKTIRVLPIYGLAALLTTYITWPFLWSAPVNRFNEVITEMSSFAWQGSVLYGGELFKAADLPWDFIPRMMLLQFTLPVLILLLPGLYFTARQLLSASSGKKTYVIILLWLIPPLAAVMLPGTVFYDNFRQVLFLVPPVFLICTAGLGFLAEKIRLWPVKALVFFLAIFPGVLGIARLHPYEYAYYNALAGGISGAAGRYETDYWCTATREGIEYLNQEAPENAVIGYNKGLEQVRVFARPDMTVLTSNAGKENNAPPLDYILVCLRGRLSPSDPSGETVIYQVERDGVPFLIVKNEE